MCASRHPTRAGRPRAGPISIALVGVFLLAGLVLPGSRLSAAPAREANPKSAEPAKSDPGKTGPVKTEAGKTEPVESEAGKTEPGRAAPSAAKGGEPPGKTAAEGQRGGKGSAQSSAARSAPGGIDVVALSIVPGLGQIMLGDVPAGITQAVLFLSFAGLASHYRGQPDYIPADEQYVDFDIFQIYLAQELDRRNLLYRELPVFNETPFHRLMRMTKDGRLAEVNPLLEYGPYFRTSVSTMNVDIAARSASHVLMYSIYSTYRDVGRAPAHESGFMDLATSPFQVKYLVDPHVWGPLAVLALLSAAQPSSGGPPTLVPPGTKSGHAAFYTATTSFNAGVSEEAFFRGFLNYSFTRSTGDPVTGGAISGVLFGLAHFDGSLASVTFPTLAGFYFAYVHYINGFDIRPGIALHFWWDIIVIALEAKRWKEDRRVSLNQNEVHYMPTLFQYRF